MANEKKPLGNIINDETSSTQPAKVDDKVEKITEEKFTMIEIDDISVASLEEKTDQTGFSGYFALDDENKLQYLERLDVKQLDLYDWCETKVNTLATIDAILLGAATLFLDKILLTNESNTICITVINTTIALLLLLPLSVSLVIALWHIRPKMGKGKATNTRPNHRSVSGMHHFKDKFEYKKHLESLTIKEICEDLVSKVHGMHENIWKNQRSIKIAVLFDLIGLASFFGIIIYTIIFR